MKQRLFAISLTLLALNAFGQATPNSNPPRVQPGPGSSGAGPVIQSPQGQKPPGPPVPGSPGSGQPSSPISGMPGPGSTPVPSGSPTPGIPGSQPPPQPYLKPNPIKANLEAAQKKFAAENAALQAALDSVKRRAYTLQTKVQGSPLLSANFKCFPPAVPVSPAGNVKSEICVPDDPKNPGGNPEMSLSILLEQARSRDFEAKALLDDIQRLQQMQKGLSDTLWTISDLERTILRLRQP